MLWAVAIALCILSSVLLLWLLQSLRANRARYRIVHAEELPEILSPRLVYAIGENGHLWYAAMRCPGGCGRVLHMNLVPDMRPVWELDEHPDGTVTLEPSIWRQTDCKCHFRLTRGLIHWY